MERQRLESSQDYELIDPVQDRTLVGGRAPEAFWDDLGYHGTTEGRNMGRVAGHIGETCLFDSPAFVFRRALIFSVVM